MICGPPTAREALGSLGTSAGSQAVSYMYSHRSVQQVRSPRLHCATWSGWLRVGWPYTCEVSGAHHVLDRCLWCST